MAATTAHVDLEISSVDTTFSIICSRRYCTKEKLAGPVHSHEQSDSHGSFPDANYKSYCSNKKNARNLIAVKVLPTSVQIGPNIKNWIQD